MKTLLAVLKNKEGLCMLAFLIALASIFESTVMHGLEFLRSTGMIPAAVAAEKEPTHE
jgi:hypothetical protein